MIKNIIFDMGNVLLTFDPDYIVRSILGVSSVDEELVRCTMGVPEWKELDNGAITEQEALASMIERAPKYQREIERIMEHWHEYMIPIDGMLELVMELKQKGYGLHLLSNASLRFYEYSGRHPVFGLMDSLNISARMKLLKPQREIYEAVLNNRRLIARECLFIDDLPQNVEGARRAGIDAYQFVGVNALKDYLRQRDIL